MKIKNKIKSLLLSAFALIGAFFITSIVNTEQVKATSNYEAVIYKNDGTVERGDFPLYVYKIGRNKYATSLIDRKTIVYDSPEDFTEKMKFYTQSSDDNYDYVYYASFDDPGYLGYEAGYYFKITYEAVNSSHAVLVSGDNISERVNYPAYIYTINKVSGGTNTTYSFSYKDVFRSNLDFIESSYSYKPTTSTRTYNAFEHIPTMNPMWVTETTETKYIILDQYINGNQYSAEECWNDTYSSEITLTTITLDEMSPVLEAQVIITDVDSPFSLEYILSQVKFVDEISGELTPVVVSDNYSANMNKVGKWEIIVSATDEAGNTGTGTISVWVTDKTAPIISGNTEYISNMSNPLTEESIRSNLVATDNADGDISGSITLVEDNYTGNEDKMGTYTITYVVSDTSGNASAVYTVNITMKDDIKPSIVVKDGYSDSYTTSYKVSLSLDTLYEGIEVIDNVDSDLTYEIVENRYAGNETIPGMYSISLRTTDNSGNVSEIFVINIEVNDKIPPVFYASGLFIGVSKAQTLTHQEIVNILLTMNGLENSNMGVALLSLGGYEVDSINEPRAYTISYRLVDESGNASDNIMTATINVLGEEEVKENDIQTQLGQRANKIKEFFNDVWNVLKNIWEFFVKLFKTITFGWLWDKGGNFDPKWTVWY